jgi:hypothetical protein
MMEDEGATEGLWLKNVISKVKSDALEVVRMGIPDSTAKEHLLTLIKPQFSYLENGGKYSIKCIVLSLWLNEKM